MFYTLYAIRDTQYAIQASVICPLSSVICRLPSTSVEDPLQINLFMQNKPNFRKGQMNVSILSQTAYENKSNWTLGQNKPNSNPIKPNSCGFLLEFIPHRVYPALRCGDAGQE